MGKKLEVVYGWRTGRPPRQWAHALHRIWGCVPGEDFRTGLHVWMTRQEASFANQALIGSKLQWVDAGEEPRWQL